MLKDLTSIFGDTSGLDEKSVQFLLNALAKNNLPGFDYLEFKQSLSNLEKMDMPLEMAYKSAYATAATVGLTKEKLLQTAAHYKAVLEQEKRQFEEALKKQIHQRVVSKQEEVAKLREQVESYKAKIQQLESQISEAHKTIESADEVIQANMERIESTRDGFDETLQSLKNQIDLDVQHIEKYL